MQDQQYTICPKTGGRVFYDGSIESDSPETLMLMGVEARHIIPIINQENISEIEKYFNISELYDEEGFNTSPPTDQRLSELLDVGCEQYQIPEHYLGTNLAEYCQEKLFTKIQEPARRDVYLARLKMELDEICKMGYEKLFKTVVYVVDEFIKHNVVWGVGRGSSCACLVLFLIGLNLVDPVKYHIPMDEFFHS